MGMADRERAHALAHLAQMQNRKLSNLVTRDPTTKAKRQRVAKSGSAAGSKFDGDDVEPEALRLNPKITMQEPAPSSDGGQLPNVLRLTL